MKKIILIGSGGHFNSCEDVITSAKKFKIDFIIDKKENNKINYKVYLEKKIVKKYNFKRKLIHISVGQLRLGKKRKQLYEFYKNKGGIFPVIKSNKCYVSKSAKINEGTIIMNHVTVNSGVVIGKNCIINTGSIIEHDVIIENNVHIAPGAILLGGCIIRQNSFIGAGSLVKQNKEVYKDSIISSKKYIR